MNLNEEILSHLLNNKGLTAMPIKSLRDKADAFVFRYEDEYGVYFEIPEGKRISESFAGVKLTTAEVRLESGVRSLCLVLSCQNKDYIRMFSQICSDFVDSNTRDMIVSDPFVWWNGWKSMLGNINSSPEVYSILGEMMAVSQMQRAGGNPIWESGSAIVDISGLSYDCEVKSTVVRGLCTVDISSHFQLEERSKNLKMIYCVFEKYDFGICINDMVEILFKDGIERSEIEEILSKIGMKKGRAARRTKYRLIEMREYDIDEHFPKITKESFRGGTIPQCILRIRYTVDLSPLKYRKIEYRP